jgi:hypothetical protein
MTVLSIDGFPIPLEKFRNSIESTINHMKKTMDQLFRGCIWEDILQHIDKRTNPDNPGDWFTDSPQSSDQNMSVFNFKVNCWEQYKHRLIAHLARDSELFSKVQGQSQPHKGKLALLGVPMTQTNLIHR